MRSALFLAIIQHNYYYVELNFEIFDVFWADFETFALGPFCFKGYLTGVIAAAM